jgi:glycosyltransferase involved in cell wall biosynthesis
MADHNGFQPLVTAIIVVKDGEPYIREAIDSVVGQDYSNWELLIVDDGSIDGTVRIARMYERKFPGKVRLVFHRDGKNHGISASRNRGIKEAGGTYIGFLDADDVWLPDKLSEQTRILNGDPLLDMVYGRTLIWHSWDHSSERPDFYYPLGVDGDARYQPPALFKLLLENKSQTPTTCNALIRSSLFKRLGGFEDRFRLMFEDQTFFAKALAFSACYVSNRTWAKYRQHSKSCSAISGSRGGDLAARYAFLKWLNASMMHKDVPFPVRIALWRALALAFWKLNKRSFRQRIKSLR